MCHIRHSHQIHTRPHRTSTPSQHALDNDWIGSRQTEQQVNRGVKPVKPRRRVQPGAESRELYDDDTKQPASRCAPGLCGANHTLTIRRDSALWHSSGTSLQLLRTSALRRPCSESASAMRSPWRSLIGLLKRQVRSCAPSPVRSLLTVRPEVPTESRGMEVSAPCGPRCPQRRGAWRFHHQAWAHK